jgi:hypothetical protein
MVSLDDSVGDCVVSLDDAVVALESLTVSLEDSTKVGRQSIKKYSGRRLGEASYEIK